MLVQSIGQRALHEICPITYYMRSAQQPYEVGSTVIHVLQMRELRTQWLSHCPRRGPKLGHPGTGIHSCVIGLKSIHFTQWSQAAYLLGPHMHHTKPVYISIHSLDTIMKLC